MIEQRCEYHGVVLIPILHDSDSWFDLDLTDPEWYEKVLKATLKNA